MTTRPISPVCPDCGELGKITNGKLRVEFAERYASALERRKQDLEKGLQKSEASERLPF